MLLTWKKLIDTIEVLNKIQVLHQLLGVIVTLVSDLKSVCFTGLS